MFAPPSGRYLAVSALALGILTAGVALGWAPRSVETAVLLAAGWGFFGFFAVFFRDPERAAAAGIVAPADGTIRDVTVVGPTLRISTFMNVTDVHVNRFPVDARVEYVQTMGSGFRPAYHESARHNLRCHYVLSTHLGPVEVIQMTGILARRLVPLVHPGDERRKGERLGMILLGSRVDLLLPADRVEPRVRAGDVVRAGSSTIAVERT